MSDQVRVAGQHDLDVTMWFELDSWPYFRISVAIVYPSNSFLGKRAGSDDYHLLEWWVPRLSFYDDIIHIWCSDGRSLVSSLN